MGHIGLVLTGGGARAAYQVGAVRGLAEILGPGRIPFDVLAGISAGAINSVVLACGAEDFPRAADRLRATWAGLTPDRVFRTGALKLAGTGSRWIRSIAFAGGMGGGGGVNFLLDPSPLRDLLSREVPLGRMRRHLRTGRLRGVALSATNYHTGAGVTFFEGAPEIEPWTRSSRVGIRGRLTIDHVMASAAIPVFFPPVRIGRTFYGDGCIRMHYPMSPAVHMGAERIVAISVRHLRPPADAAREQAADATEVLPVSEIAGVLLNAVFLDSLDSDLERLERINETLALIPPERLERSDLRLRPVPALVLRPSQDLGKLAADEYGRFPAMLRYLLRGIGATGTAGEDLLSYLAFEPIYVRRAMELGHADTLARRAEVEEFFLAAPGGERRGRAAS